VLIWLWMHPLLSPCRRWSFRAPNEQVILSLANGGRQQETGWWEGGKLDQDDSAGSLTITLTGID